VGDLLDAVDGPAVAVIAVVTVALFLWFLLPVVIALIELFALALIVSLGVLVRIGLRRPWLVDAERLDRHGRHTWQVVGWRRSGRAVTELADKLRLGQPPTQLPH